MMWCDWVCAVIKYVICDVMKYIMLINMWYDWVCVVIKYVMLWRILC